MPRLSKLQTEQMPALQTMQVNSDEGSPSRASSSDELQARGCASTSSLAVRVCSAADMSSIETSASGYRDSSGEQSASIAVGSYGDRSIPVAGQSTTSSTPIASMASEAPSKQVISTMTNETFHSKALSESNSLRVNGQLTSAASSASTGPPSEDADKVQDSVSTGPGENADGLAGRANSQEEEVQELALALKAARLAAQLKDKHKLDHGESCQCDTITVMRKALGDIANECESMETWLLDNRSTGTVMTHVDSIGSRASGTGGGRSSRRPKRRSLGAN